MDQQPGISSTDPRPATALIVMGTSGTGKTTIAELLGARLGWPTAEADEFHPRANIDKMAGGAPLDDEDRWPWLRGIRDFLSEQADAGRNTIVTCSALKRRYRDLLRESRANVTFVHLYGPIELISGRMAGRRGHFMPVSLLRSQFETLEKLESDEPGIVVDVSASPQEIADHVVGTLNLAP